MHLSSVHVDQKVHFYDEITFSGYLFLLLFVCLDCLSLVCAFGDGVSEGVKCDMDFDLHNFVFGF